MNPQLLLVPILLPVFLAIITFIIPRTVRGVRETITLLGLIIGVYIAWFLFGCRNLTLSLDWIDGLGFDLRLYHFSGFTLLWINIFGFLISLYSVIKMASHKRVNEYYLYLLLTLAFANGAILADNFLVLLFFWEGLLLTLYGFITLGSTENTQRTAIKAFIINGFCDFCMILGISIFWAITGKAKFTEIAQNPIQPVGLGMASFILILIGALGKGGSLPFHTWIPDAAIDAPVSFMAFLPGALEKLLGIYLASKVALELFVIEPNSPMSILMMTIGGITIVLAVLMALIQKDYKKLLSFHAISQYGYMILGIGTALPIGIVGGIFHMLNNAIYKSGLFMVAGAVEHRTGTTELKRLGGLRGDMPITALCYLVLAAAISGIWPLNGFVSKEMVIHGAYETGFIIFALFGWVGAIFTFASFLKAGHSIFLGPRSREVPKIRECESPFLIPMVIMAILSIIFGVYNYLPLKLFLEPIIAGRIMAGEHIDIDFSTHALDLMSPIASVSIFMLLIALSIHLYGWNRAEKQAHQASEVIHKLPIIRTLYDWSEARFFDIYEQGIKFLKGLARMLYVAIDRPVDYFYEKIITVPGQIGTKIFQYAHNGHYANYLAWCVAGLVIIIYVLLSLIR
ncbi:MAG: proton-conducting transporter membrane subunit [candidate division WOR-3 bacterium]